MHEHDDDELLDLIVRMEGAVATLQGLAREDFNRGNVHGYDRLTAKEVVRCRQS